METKKRSEINRALAGYFLSLESGNNIDSIRVLSTKLKASIGLISEAISFIESAGGVEIERRGQLGSLLKSISIGKLWEIASGQPLVIAHTLPSNRRYEGLATALRTVFQDVGIDCYFIFIRGSRTRINALREKRCHIAITSLFAANGLSKQTEILPSILPEGSFVSAHQLYLRKTIIDNNQTMRVAVDPASYDQIKLSEIEFENQDATFKQINFMNIFHYLSSGEVDAAIWTEDDMRPFLNKNIICQSLSPETRKITKDSDQQAALVIRRKDVVIQQLIQKVIDPAKIINIQNKVINGEIIPEY